jgi:hypothetical protein
MSAFEMGGERFEPSATNYGWGPPVHDMSSEIGKVLPVGSRFTYDYDFGSTTQLSGQSVGLVAGGRSKLSVLARNETITWGCDGCNGDASAICAICGTLSCECTETCTECGEAWEEMGLPVVNSPRMGVCGYTGSG